MTKIAQNLYKKAIDENEAAGSFGIAANLAVRAGMIERAIDNYEKADMFKEAAELMLSLSVTVKYIV